jgi:sensor histidine kinase YesM
MDRTRLKLYFQIGVAFFVLHIIGELFTNIDTFFPRMINNAWLGIFIVLLNYYVYEKGVPFIKLEWGRLLLLPFLLFGLLMVLSFGFYFWRTIGIGIGIYTELKTYDDIYKGVENHVGTSMFSLFFFGVIKYTYDYRKLKEMTQQLRIEKQEAELNYLKSQTNPHFLFNTLNNIYSLARDKSDIAPESILQLSKILRFMLYEANGDFIAVEQEIKIISDYTSLEKLRYDESLRINFNYDVEDMKQAIPPLLMIPLVENAFKHGASETRNAPFVDIHLSIKSRVLNLAVKNSTEGFQTSEPIQENIGLSNLRRQLELLFSDYNLSVEHQASVFSASLRINLASHV